MSTLLSQNTYKIKSFSQDPFYKDILEITKNYNRRLCYERRQRLPFLDSQTGVAQNHTNLLMPQRYRGPGQRHGQLYTYPSRRWKKKTSLSLIPEISMMPRVKISESDMLEAEAHQAALTASSGSFISSTVEKALNNNSNNSETDTATISKDVPSLSVKEDSNNAFKDDYIIDWEEQNDPLDPDRRNSDSSDYEEAYVKRRGKKSTKDKKISLSQQKDPTFKATSIKLSKNTPGGKGRGRKEKEISINMVIDPDKPFTCELCTMRYKTRPGLNYHMTHSHNKSVPPEEDDIPIIVSQPPIPQSFQLKTTGSVNFIETKKSTSMESTGSSQKLGTKYCDFCLGDETQNKRTGEKESMVSCADCGRSGHPSCLQFSPNMIISVRKYPWQCIECKSCGLCGTSDNDEQLLFCDDCDRGYHMYCLKPPLTEPPEGSWSCHLCIVEFYNGRKPDDNV